jgi:hypothetical protein
VTIPRSQIGDHVPGGIADLVTLGGAGLSIAEPNGEGEALNQHPGVVTLGVHRDGALPLDDLEAFDLLLSADPAAPRPWVGLSPQGLDEAILRLQTRISAQPTAAAAAAQVLRTTLRLPLGEALVLESLAYSMLLASEGFGAWRAANPPRDRLDDGAPRVLVELDGAVLHIRLNRPSARNAFDARMRDALTEALEFALIHPDKPAVVLSGLGPVFSAGGDLDEFGRAADPGRAHLIRTLRSPARLIAALGDRVTARLHGACIGAGIEAPAAAGRVTAAAGTVFRLPEVSMGLIPGAGGTATIARRIGRRRAAYMALSGVDIDLETALAWGLVDAEAPAA